MKKILALLALASCGSPPGIDSDIQEAEKVAELIEKVPDRENPREEKPVTATVDRPKVDPPASIIEIEMEKGRLVQRMDYELRWSPNHKYAPDPKLSAEAEGYLGRHGGSLTWHPEAAGGGQWSYEPNSDCGKGICQYDQSASIAIILAGVEAEAMCRICGPKRRGRWVENGDPRRSGCTYEQRMQIERLYCKTSCRLERDGDFYCDDDVCTVSIIP